MLPGDQDSATAQDGGQAAGGAAGDGQPAVYGDAAYGSGELIGRLDDADIYNGIKCQPPAAVKGCFPKDRFTIDLDGKTVTCPAGVTVPIRAARRGSQVRRSVPGLPAGRPVHHRQRRPHHHHRPARGPPGRRPAGTR